MLIQIWCDKNYKCKNKDIAEFQNKTLPKETQRKKPEMKNKIELNTSFDEHQKNIVIGEPHSSLHHCKKKSCINAHYSCPDHQVYFDNQTSTLNVPSFNLQSNKKSSPISSCQKFNSLPNTQFKTYNQTVSSPSQTVSSPSQTAFTPCQTHSTPSQTHSTPFQTVVDIENADSDSETFHSM